MATTSEIQVTEAYIGLLGRAPDPAGLAYWAAELDAAVAAGQDPAVALKKLTNDITLNAEWDTGLGQYDETTLAGATNVVKGMYLNLFERPAKQADIDYWAPKIVSGEFSASEMAVALIQGSQQANDGAGNSDSQTLALKQEAATYYVENVSQADFNRETAKNAVDSVDSPNTLQDSKDATDIIVSGEGASFTFKAATTDTVPATGGDDTATGVVGTGVTYANVDSFLDKSTTDNDTMTLSGDANFDFGPTSNVENINVSLARRDLAGGFSIDADKETGGSTINLTVAKTVNVGGVDLAGEQTVTISNLASDLTTTNVKDLTVTLDPAASQTFTLDASLATLDIGAVDYNDTTVTLANNDVTFALTGAGANDVISITADNEVTINVGANDVESMTLAGSNNDVVFTIAGVNDANDITYTASGSNDITLAGSDLSFAGASFVDNNSGTEALKLTATGGAASIENFGVLSGGVELAGNAAFNLSLTSGNTVTNSKAITAGAITLNANDTATDSSITLVLGQNTAGINTDKFESVTITANDSKATSTGALDFDSVGVVTITGANDITTGAISNTNTIEISGEDLSVGGVTATNEVTLTGTKSVAATGVLTVAGDITATAGGTGDMTLGGAVTVTKGNVKASGDDVNVASTIAVTAGDITLTSTANDVDMEDNITATKGAITITAVEDVELLTDKLVKSTAGSVKVAAGNDVNMAGGITAQNDVDVDAGAGVAGLDIVNVGTITVTGKGNVTLDGDDVNQTAGGIDVNAGNITVTASNNVDLDAALDTEAGNLTITATAGSITLDNTVAVDANDITYTAGTSITDDSTTTGDGAVTFTAGTGAGCDIAHSGTIDTEGAITMIGDDISVGQLDANDGDIIIDAGNAATTTAAIDTNDGNITITADIVAGNTGLTVGGTVVAANDVTMTVVGDVDINQRVTSQNGDISITGNEIDITDTASTTTALSATSGTITLNGTSDDKTNEVSTIAHAVTAKNVTLVNGMFDINATLTATDTLSIQGDTDTQIDDVEAGAIVLTTANDVEVTGTTDTTFIVASGTGDYDFSVIEYDADTTAIDVTTGSGNDIMDLDDAANVTSVYTVKTMDGNDNITITDVAATSVIDAGAGNDTIDAAVLGVAITVKAGDGVDAITVADGSDASIDGGNDSDTIKVADNANLSDDDVTWTNIEKIQITGGNTGITLSEAQLDSDGTWELQNTAGVVTVNAATGKGTLSAAGVTFVAGSSAGFKLVGVDGQADVLTGSSKADTFDGGTGADTLTGGSGLDKFVIASGDSTAAAMDKIADFNNGGTEVIDYGNNLTKATNTSGAAATSGNASIDANGLATFHADDTTLALKIAAVNADIAGANTTVADLVAIFQHGGNTYVFISGGTDGATTDDTVIELTGVSLSTVTVDGNNDFTGG